MSSDETTIDDPIQIQQNIINTPIIQYEHGKQITTEIITQLFRIGSTFYSNIQSNNNQLYEQIIQLFPQWKQFPNHFINKQSSEQTELSYYQKEQYRILFITKIDQLVEKKYVLLFVSLFNFSLLYQEVISSLSSLPNQLNQSHQLIIEKKQQDLQKQNISLHYWIKRIECFLSTEFISL